MSQQGFRIENLNELKNAVEHHKSVVCPDCPAWRKPRPAAFMMNMSGTILHRLFYAGMYYYNKTTTETK